MEQENRETAAIQGDVLESILSFVPLIDLATAMHVSKQWRLAVSSSLLYLNPSKPWLFFHQRSARFPHSISTLAFDTRSKCWMRIERPAPPRPAPPRISTAHLRSSHSGLLYAMSMSTLSFSSDPFHLRWHLVPGPPSWRPDPIVALVGRKLIVAGGGGGEIEDNPLAVEIYDAYSLRREPDGEPMPAGLKDSAASSWVSAATNGSVLYVMEKESGVTYTFDSESNSWSNRANDLSLCHDRTGFSHHHIITFAGGRLILIGITDVGLKVWSVDPENFCGEEIGEMPKAMFEKMKDESFQMSSMTACSAGNWVYVYNPCEIGDVYVCELLGGGGCRWTLERVPLEYGRRSWKTVAVTCSEVGISDVEEGLRSEKWTCMPILST